MPYSESHHFTALSAPCSLARPAVVSICLCFFISSSSCIHSRCCIDRAGLFVLWYIPILSPAPVHSHGSVTPSAAFFLERTTDFTSRPCSSHCQTPFFNRPSTLQLPGAFLFLFLFYLSLSTRRLATLVRLIVHTSDIRRSNTGTTALSDQPSASSARPVQVSHLIDSNNPAFSAKSEIISSRLHHAANARGAVFSVIKDTSALVPTWALLLRP